MTLDPIKAAIAPYLELIQLGLAVAVLCLVGLAGWKVHSWRADSHALAAVSAELKAEKACSPGSACAGRLINLQADGTKAVEEALQSAQEAARAQQAQLASQAQAERDRLAAAARDATAKADAWRAKYEAALKAPDGSCAAWSRESIRCPVN